MKNLLQRLFGIKQTDSAKKRSDFSIEYYPLTDRYYPKYKNYYMGTEWTTGIIVLKESYRLAFADWGKTEEEADKIIERFKEHQWKENVVTIKK
jgi:hypothetical protein